MKATRCPGLEFPWTVSQYFRVYYVVRISDFQEEVSDIRLHSEITLFFYPLRCFNHYTFL